MKFYSSGQIANWCGVHQRTVSRWIVSGKLVGHQLPGKGDYRVTEADLLTFLKKEKFPLPNQCQQKKILLVDDDMGVLTALNRLYRFEGYEVIYARDGFTAGALLAKHDPCLMTLDIKMPGLDGIEILQFLRSGELELHTKVVVVSGASNELMQQALDEGADAVISKPFNNKELLTVSNQLLDLNWTAV